MPNANKPAGLSPVQYLNGAPWNGGGRMYYIASSNPNAFAIGDPVVLAGSSDANGVPEITLATAGAGNSIVGAIVSGAGATTFGGEYGVPADAPVVIPATKTRAYYVLVADDPNIIFEVQEQNTGTPLTAAEVGNNANLVAGANNGYVSGWQLDNAGEGTGVTLQVKLLGLSQYPGGAAVNAFGLLAKWLVLINNHCYRVGSAGF